MATGLISFAGDLDADCIGEGYQSRIRVNVGHNVDRSADALQWTGRKAIFKQYDGPGTVVLPRNPFQALNIPALRINRLSPFPGLRIYIFVAVNQICAGDAKLAQGGGGKACKRQVLRW